MRGTGTIARTAALAAAGSGPRFWFQMVPHVKAVKNRLHLDAHASGGSAVPLATRRERVEDRRQDLRGPCTHQATSWCALI